ncbi:hypothetical protein D9M68_996710 [compost metagenome]
MLSASFGSEPSGCFRATFWSSFNSPVAAFSVRLKAAGPPVPPTRPSTTVALTWYSTIDWPDVEVRPLLAPLLTDRL